MKSLSLWLVLQIAKQSVNFERLKSPRHRIFREFSSTLSRISVPHDGTSPQNIIYVPEGQLTSLSSSSKIYSKSCDVGKIYSQLEFRT